MVVPSDQSKSPENYSDDSDDVEDEDMQLSQFGDAFVTIHDSRLATGSIFTDQKAISTSNDDPEVELLDTDLHFDAENDSDSSVELTANQADQSNQALRDSDTRKTDSKWYIQKSTSKPFVIMG